jgi:hypothetical protein
MQEQEQVTEGAVGPCPQCRHVQCTCRQQLDAKAKYNHLTQQHKELCKQFWDLGVCAHGIHCQRIHDYTQTNPEHLARMMDYLIGQKRETQNRLDVIEHHLSRIMTHSRLDVSTSTTQWEAAFQAISWDTKQIAGRSSSLDKARPYRNSAIYTTVIYTSSY